MTLREAKYHSCPVLQISPKKKKRPRAVVNILQHPPGRMRILFPSLPISREMCDIRSHHSTHVRLMG